MLESADYPLLWICLSVSCNACCDAVCVLAAPSPSVCMGVAESAAADWPQVLRVICHLTRSHGWLALCCAGGWVGWVRRGRCVLRRAASEERSMNKLRHRYNGAGANVCQPRRMTDAGASDGAIEGPAVDRGARARVEVRAPSGASLARIDDQTRTLTPSAKSSAGDLTRKRTSASPFCLRANATLSSHHDCPIGAARLRVVEVPPLVCRCWCRPGPSRHRSRSARLTPTAT